MTGREISAARALKVLGEDRFVQFIRMVASDSDCPLAVRLLADQLSVGKSIEDSFFTGDDYGYRLSVKRLEDTRFEIEFGCQEDPLSGDGARWEVELAEDGSITRVAEIDSWIS